MVLSKGNPSVLTRRTAFETSSSNFRLLTETYVLQLSFGKLHGVLGDLPKPLPLLEAVAERKYHYPSQVSSPYPLQSGRRLDRLFSMRSLRECT